jgi:hypothetical protein
MQRYHPLHLTGKMSYLLNGPWGFEWVYEPKVRRPVELNVMMYVGR